MTHPDGSAPAGPVVLPPVPFEQEPRGSRLDRWWARVVATPVRHRLWVWGGPVLVALLAAWLRLTDLGTPHRVVFDETFYLKDAWSLLGNGYESTWPDEADARFEAGETQIYSDTPSYVVHPPLGKWLIALGMAATGPENAFGWRLATAIAGITAVVVLMAIAHLLTRSTLLTVIAGYLFAVDGNAIVMARVSLLDNFLMLFTLLAVGAVLLDRRREHARLTAMIAARAEPWPGPGPVLLWRPWLLAAGLLLGAATAVKWSGLYFLAVLGVYVVVSDLLLRRRLGLSRWWAALGTQAPVSFVLLVPVALLAYLASWSGWLLTDGGWDRQWVQAGGEAWEGVLGWVPLWFQNLYHYHASAYGWHVGLSRPHPYQSNPLTWLLMIRPTNMFYEGTSDGEGGCGAAECAAQITGLGNPLIWWAGTAALVYLLYRFVRRREWQVALVLTGMAAGYLPWLLYLHRTVFQFYSIAFEPYLILGLTLVLGAILGTARDPEWRRIRGLALTGVFLVFVTLLSVFFWPLWTAQEIPLWYWQLHIWLPTWR